MDIGNWRGWLALAFSAALAAPAAAAPPLSAYGGLPTIEDVSISPDGKQLALVVTNGEQRMIGIEDLATETVTKRIGTGPAKVRYIGWAGDAHVIVVSSVTASPMDIMTTQREWEMAFSLDVASGKVSQLLRDAGEEAMNSIYGTPVVRPYNGEPTVFLQGVTFHGGEGLLTLFRIDLDHATSQVVEVGSSDARDWAIGPDGRPVAQEIYSARTGRWVLRVKSSGGWREAVDVTALTDPPSLMGLGRDGRSVLYAARDDKHDVTWTEARLDDTKAAAPLVIDEADEPVRDPQDGRLVGYHALVGNESRYTFFDPDDQKQWNAVEAAFPGAIVTLQSWSADHRKIVVRVDSLTDGPAFAVVDLTARKATWLGAEYAGVGAEGVSPQKVVRFKARDGLDLTGYVTIPRGKTPKNLPLIVFPHGGPATRDGPGFDWWAQAMASRGYAVLQVNFRGSDGLGQDLLEAGYGQWGRKMQTDLSDGVKALASAGVIDPKRVCIVGASYGGYAALAGAALDPGVYRCAASYGGISDLRRFVTWSNSRNGRGAFRYWTRFMGASDGADPVLTELSPAAHVDRVGVPVLLVHGRDDSVVPPEQSQEMADALQKAGKPVELVMFKGEDHWLSRGETRLQMLQAVMTFVEKNNPPD